MGIRLVFMSLKVMFVLGKSFVCGYVEVGSWVDVRINFLVVCYFWSRRFFL